MRASSRLRPALPALLVLLTACDYVGCEQGSPRAARDEKRKSLAGESCTKTADCTAPLGCVGQRCVRRAGDKSEGKSGKAKARATPKECGAQEACTSFGRCTLRGSRCIAGSDAECRASSGCRGYGACTARHGRCVATDDEACRKSAGCKALGRCHARDGHCAAANDGDCKQSDVCAAQRACTAANGQCVSKGKAK